MPNFKVQGEDKRPCPPFRRTKMPGNKLSKRILLCSFCMCLPRNTLIRSYPLYTAHIFNCCGHATKTAFFICDGRAMFLVQRAQEIWCNVPSYLLVSMSLSRLIVSFNKSLPLGLDENGTKTYSSTK